MRALAKSLLPLAVWAALGVGVCQAETASQASASQLDNVTVTARKVEEDVQKIPISASVFSGALIDDAGLRDMRDLTRLAPNVYLKKSTSENIITMRGVTSFETSIYGPTALYVDDLMLPLHYAHNIDLVDIERVEVLRGPQGSLYGGNSLAGVINVITRQPGNEARASLSADFGAYPSAGDHNPGYKLGGGVSGPIVEDRWYLGLSGQIDQNDGYTTNLFNNDQRAGAIDRKTARATLRWTPTSQWDISFIGDILKNDDNIGVYRFDQGPYRTPAYHSWLDTDNYNNEQGDGQALRISHQGQAVKILSVTGRRGYRNDTLQDYDCTADPQNDWGRTLAAYKDTMFSQELRFSSVNAGGSPLSWLAGAYGMIEDTDIDQQNPTIAQSALTSIDTNGYALFGEATYTLWDRLRLTGGLRWDGRDSKGHKRDTGVDVSDQMDGSELLPKLSLGYDITADAFGYVTVSRGYLAGGYNYALAVDKESFSYDPEYTWNYELGLKTSWLDRKLTANLALFYIQMADKQVYNMVGVSSPITKVDNAAQAHSMGVELEMAAQPLQGLEITLGFGLTKAEVDDWTATERNSDNTELVRVSYDGKTIPNSPEYNGHLAVQYRHATGLFARADLAAVGEVYADAANSILDDPYALLDLRLGYETKRYDVYVWGRNVLDAEYHAIAYNWDGYKMVQDGEPAMFGVTLTLRY